MAKILVTGGLGHLGSRLIRDLSRVADVELVRILDNFSTQRYSSLFNLPDSVKYQLVEGDIRHAETVEMAVKDIDVLFHLAAITDAPSTFNAPRLTRSVNYLGTRKVIDAAVKAGVKKIIYPSTTSVYGPTRGIALENCESNDYKPASPYAEYKLAGENEVLKANEKFGVNSVVLRFGTVYGPSIGMRFHTAVNKFIFLGCSGRPLTIWKDALDQKRPYLDIEDAMRAFIFMLDSDLGKGEVFNVLTENATVFEVINIIKEFLPDVEIRYTDSPILNQFSYYTDDSKIRKLGFIPNGNLRDGVEKTIKWLSGLLP